MGREFCCALLETSLLRSDGAIDGLTDISGCLTVTSALRLLGCVPETDKTDVK